MRHQLRFSLLVMCVLVLAAPPGCGPSPKEISTEELAQRLATDSAFLPVRKFLATFIPEEKLPTMDALARCQGLSTSQRAARVVLLTPIKWDPVVESAMFNLQRLPGMTCDKLAKAEEKDLLGIAQTWSKNYAKWKERQEELNRLEMQLNEQFTRENAKGVRAAEKFFRGGEDGGKSLKEAEQDLAQAFRKVLRAHPDVEKELRASLRAEQAAVTKELQASRAKADDMLRTVDGQR